MRFLWIVFILIGAWFLASAATENGLMPSGHGAGRLSEVVLGVVLLGYAIFRLTKGSGTRR